MDGAVQGNPVRAPSAVLPRGLQGLLVGPPSEAHSFTAKFLPYFGVGGGARNATAKSGSAPKRHIAFAQARFDA